MFSTKMKGWVGTWALEFLSAMVDSKKNNWQTTLRTWLKNNPSCSNPSSVMRRHFPLIPFLSQWKIQLSTGLAALLSLSNVSTPPIFFSFTKLYYLANSSASTWLFVYQLSLESLIYWPNLSLFHTSHQISWKKALKINSMKLSDIFLLMLGFFLENYFGIWWIFTNF